MCSIFVTKLRNVRKINLTLSTKHHFFCSIFNVQSFYPSNVLVGFPQFHSPVSWCTLICHSVSVEVAGPCSERRVLKLASGGRCLRMAIVSGGPHLALLLQEMKGILVPTFLYCARRQVEGNRNRNLSKRPSIPPSPREKYGEPGCQGQMFSYLNREIV